MSCNCRVSRILEARRAMETYRIGSVDFLRWHERPLLDVRHCEGAMVDNCVLKCSW